MKPVAPFHAFLSVAVSSQLLVGCADTSPTEVISLPSGYIGWVRIDYGVKGAKPIPLKNNRLVLVIPPSGHLKTSSLPLQGVVNEELEYVQGTTRTQLNVANTLWDDGVGGANGKLCERTFFVGTQAQSELSYKVDLPVGGVSANNFLAWTNGRDLTYQNLVGRQFAHAKLRGANARSADLRRANFQKADLSYAILGSDNTGANFRGAHLQAATLIDGTFAGANLRDCDLRMARLQGVDLSRAKIQNANFANAEYDARTKWPGGFDVHKRGLLFRPLVRTQN